LEAESSDLIDRKSIALYGGIKSDKRSTRNKSVFVSARAMSPEMSKLPEIQPKFTD